MKKIATLAVATLFVAGTVFAQEKAKTQPAKSTAKTEKKADCPASCQQSGAKKSCCKQPSKTAAMRVSAANKKTTK
ncbi:hypothetical protein [Chitinophaga sp. Cy-1792]|uniref:hypothetical protein n=1 Tax=Chitinophaga sp. Cy-1792 TaxID=2608339 RepID=UPI00142017C8|nr:hypothetical protein [Chitinophaga sp. Cy-1792]NIG52485.1 hypothetical protein [Chitinophaga sp. Cy-1792]